MRILGIVLVVIGAVALAYGGIGYDRQKTVLDMGPLKATTTEHKTLPISPVIGGLALLGGVVLLMSRGKRVV
jgi:hypothetical protein